MQSSQPSSRIHLFTSLSFVLTHLLKSPTQPPLLELLPLALCPPLPQEFIRPIPPDSGRLKQRMIRRPPFLLSLPLPLPLVSTPPWALSPIPIARSSRLWPTRRRGDPAGRRRRERRCSGRDELEGKGRGEGAGGWGRPAFTSINIAARGRSGVGRGRGDHASQGLGRLDGIAAARTAGVRAWFCPGRRDVRSHERGRREDRSSYGLSFA